ncbi:MAG: hypothetical protein IKH27_04950 [Oscillospiraceae bacterium]|nr:hypothetical protein [Oscillospiraceae bacterium]
MKKQDMTAALQGLPADMIEEFEQWHSAKIPLHLPKEKSSDAPRIWRIGIGLAAAFCLAAALPVVRSAVGRNTQMQVGYSPESAGSVQSIRGYEYAMSYEGDGIPVPEGGTARIVHNTEELSELLDQLPDEFRANCIRDDHYCFDEIDMVFFAVPLDDVTDDPLNFTQCGWTGATLTTSGSLHVKLALLTGGIPVPVDPASGSYAPPQNLYYWRSLPKDTVAEITDWSFEVDDKYRFADENAKGITFFMTPDNDPLYEEYTSAVGGVKLFEIIDEP